MHDALLVDEVDPVDDLQHVFDHLSLRQLKVLVDDPLEELATRDPTGQTHRVTTTTWIVTGNAIASAAGGPPL